MITEFSAIALPYAKAAFNFAIETQSIDHWQHMLTYAAEVIKNKEIKKTISYILKPEKIAKLLIEICDNKLDNNCQNLIKIMAENGRLNALPDVLRYFTQFHMENEGILEIELASVDILSKKQTLKIINLMKKHMSRKVKLNCKIDRSLIAGIIIRIDDIVIDGSLRGRLEHFANVLLS